MRITLNNPSNVTLGRCLDDDAVSIQFKDGDNTVEVWVGNVQALGLSVALRDWAKRSQENEALAMCDYKIGNREPAGVF